MDTRALGSHGLTVSAIGFGCMGMSQGYGATDDEESLRTLRRAMELGITLFDTAMSYGAGHNEELLGRAVRGRRDEVAIATKFGIVRGRDGVRLDARPERIRGYCEESLARLQVTHLDLYYLHRVDPQVPVEESIGAMAELVAEGKVRYLGLSEVSVEQMERAAAVHPISAVQSEWSLWWRDIEPDVVPAARRLGIGLVPYSPLGRGFLAAPPAAAAFPPGDFRNGDPRFGGEHRRRNEVTASAFGKLAAELGITPAQLALAWLLAQGGDVVPIPGTRRPDRVRENADSVSVTLSPADIARLEALAPRSAWSGDRKSFAAYRTARVPATGTE